MTRAHPLERPPGPAPANGLPPPARSWAYFFDIDGTLVDIAESPAVISVDSGLRERIEQLHRSAGGAVALISGRAITDIDGFFPGARLPAAGQHGAERRDAAGRLSRQELAPARLDEARRRLTEAAAQHTGLLFEDKGLSLALHYRGAPRLAGFAHRLARTLQARIGREYCVLAGKRVVELKPAGRDKGAAVLEFMREEPFRGRTPVFIGDDVTDEFGFTAVNRLGGYSVKVGPGRTAAHWRLANVGAVRAWLEQR